MIIIIYTLQLCHNYSHRFSALIMCVRQSARMAAAIMSSFNYATAFRIINGMCEVSMCTDN